MKIQLLNIILIALLSGFLSTPAITQDLQDTTTIWLIETLDGNEFYGTIREKTETEIRLETANLGLITIPLSQIKSMKPIEEKLIKEGELWMENPQATRYFWAPNGIGLKKGEGYYQNVWVMFNQVSVGFTDNLSAGIGIVPLFLFAGSPTPVWITPKFSIPVARDKFHLGGGALVGTVIGEENAFFGILYGISTFGNRDHNLTLGLGYGFTGEDWARSPAITISGFTRISPRTYLISENYLVGVTEDRPVIFSIGGRTVWRSVSLDYGLIIPAGTGVDTFVAVPWLGLVVPFGG
jgi:hypothetical protein